MTIRQEFSSQMRFATLVLVMLGLGMMLAPASGLAQTFTILHNFTASRDGGYPQLGVLPDGHGNLYGITWALIKLTERNGNWVVSPLNYWGSPAATTLAFGPNGSLYATRPDGGSDGVGDVINLTPPPEPCRSVSCPWILTELFSFTGNNGAIPYRDIVFDHDGNLYGTTEEGGQNGFGVAYELSPSHGSWTQTILYNFPPNDSPSSGLTFDQAGNLFGASSFNLGAIVYELTLPGPHYQALHNLSWQQGADVSGINFDNAGNIYGGAECGGGNGEGSIFELTASGGDWHFQTIYTFTTGDQNYCGGPDARISMDANGNIYGTTHSGGAFKYGSVFKLSPSNGSWIFTDLHDFCATGPPCSDGQYPLSTVTFDGQGNLYGTTEYGGADNYGLVWEITP